MTGLELRDLLVASGTGIDKFETCVDHVLAPGYTPEELIVALESAPRDMSTTVAKAAKLVALHRQSLPVTAPEVVAETPDFVPSMSDDAGDANVIEVGADTPGADPDQNAPEVAPVGMSDFGV